MPSYNNGSFWEAIAALNEAKKAEAGGTVAATVALRLVKPVKTNASNALGYLLATDVEKRLPNE